MASVRTSLTLLKSRLGEPESLDMDTLHGTTIMQYKLGWSCGCKAEGSGTDYLFKPCDKHAALAALAG
jgi:hypothetical protein